jgi:aarF domain-containing kinase
LFPIVADYWIQTSSRSPLVQYRNYNDKNLVSDDSKEWGEKNKQRIIQNLHEKHAPSILQVMLNLKGLYIKLGQVLSVTALPVPEPYRVLFRTLQSDVPGHEEYESIVKPTLEKELVEKNSKYQNLEDIFEYIDPIPCGAASIGQAHRATLKTNDKDNKKTTNVVIKVQYPNAAWQVPADIQCVGDFLKICIWAGVVDSDSSKMSFEEFSRQFLSELDYQQEMNNLKAVYDSSLDPSAPYIKHNVVIPKVYQEFCTNKIITMSFLPGVTMEMEAKRQLEMLGIDTSGGISKIIKDAANDAAQHPDDVSSGELVRRVTKMGTFMNRDDIDNEKTTKKSWNVRAFLSTMVTRLIDIDSILWAVRTGKKALLWYQAAFVTTIQMMPKGIVPLNWQEWSETHRYAAEQAKTLGEIDSWCRALFDVHGHQIFNLGVFNADPHPGNILIDTKQNQIGLIDYGQVKRLTAEDQLKVARLILSVANNESDESIARMFREMNIITKNDSTEFLATFGRLMFGKFKPEYLQHSFHRKLHSTDRILYFPKELSMVYRTSLLLRGLGVSLQLNYSVGDEWKVHAQECVNRYEAGTNNSNESKEK